MSAARVDPAAVGDYLRGLQERIVSALEAIDGKSFRRDPWTRQEGGGGDTRVIEEGNVFERGGVAFSHVHGSRLPPSASASRPELAGRGFEAMGVSLVLHPRNPHCPTVHMNVRFFIAPAAGAEPVFWFGGGMDLTPYYGFEEDCAHFHAACRGALAPFGAQWHPEFKRWCDEYFVLKHRGEPRGIGGIFFDDLHEPGFERSFAMMRSVGDAFPGAYAPIVERRRGLAYGERERAFQAYRRGRYVEFNLVWDRGTLFGLQSGGRTESILMSMPPSAQWRYDWKPEPGSPEERLYREFLVARELVNFAVSRLRGSGMSLPRAMVSRFTAVLVASAFCSASALAQSWPAKPARVIVPFGPGGSADTLGRLAATKLSEGFGQSFVVENRGGAGGMIGSEIVARSAPDGYTLVVSGIASHAIGPAMSDKPPFDPLRDFTHIALFGGPPLVLAVNPSLPAKSLQEFIQLLKAKPDSVSYGSPGVGTHGHLFAELIKQRQGIQMAHVPYKGAAQAVADLIAGHLQAVSTTLTTAGAQIRAGKAIALAISAEKRLPEYPAAPTFKELGYPDLTAITWFSLSGPAGMPADMVTRINAETRKGLHMADARERLRPEGIEPGDLDPKQFTEFVAAEVKRWTPVVKASGARAE